MLNIVLRALVTAVGLWVATKVVPGVHVGAHDYKTLIEAAVLLMVVNAIVRPILTLLTLPVTVLTLGLFLFVVNGLMILLVAHFIKTFQVHGLVAAILTTLVVWVVSLAANMFIGPPEARRRA